MSATIGRTVDRLGEIKAQIADLEAKEEALKAQLAAAGVGGYDGKAYHASVSESDREYVDYRAVVSAMPKTAKLKKLLADNTATKVVISVRVTSR